MLGRCAVFAGGFDLAAATHLFDALDEYVVLDVLDSLVRKSLVTVEHRGGHARYGLLETIRQFAEEQLAATGDIAEIRDRHARYYAAQAIALLGHLGRAPDAGGRGLGGRRVRQPPSRVPLGRRPRDLDTATAIAAHTASLAFLLMRYEPVGWAVEHSRCRHRRECEPASPPLHGRRAVHVHGTAARCCRLRRAGDSPRRRPPLRRIWVSVEPHVEGRLLPVPS